MMYFRMKQTTVNKALKDSYDRSALSFGKNFRASGYHSSLSLKQHLAAILKHLTPLQHALILDAGCGPGIYSRGLASNNTVIGLDLSGEMTRLAAQSGLHSVQGNLEALPFARNSFDIVLMAEVLQHFENPQKIVSEIAAVTRPGGKIILSSLHPGSLLHTLYRIWGGHYRGLFFHSAQKIRDGLKNAGCRIIAEELLAYPWGFNWQPRGFKQTFSFLGSSWILTARKEN